MESARAKGVRVYGLSKYYSKGKADTCRILLGYANMMELEIEKGMKLLLKAWL